MVVSIEPMILNPEGKPAAGGYREHDILVIKDSYGWINPTTGKKLIFVIEEEKYSRYETDVNI